MDLWVEFDKEPFPLEAEFPDPGPVEGVDFGGALKPKSGHLAIWTQTQELEDV